MPEAVGGGEGAAWDDVMDVGVKLESTTPGVEDTKESREISADKLFIQGEFLHRLGGGLEQGRLGYLLIFADEAAQALRDGKRDQEMVAGELPFDLFFQPLSGFMVLTGRAMPISTGAIDLVELATLIALVKSNAADFGTTGDDGINDLTVCIRHYLGVTFQVLRGEGLEDFIDCGHSQVPPLPD